MKHLILLLSLVACYLSLPITPSVVADGWDEAIPGTRLLSVQPAVLQLTATAAAADEGAEESDDTLESAAAEEDAPAAETKKVAAKKASAKKKKAKKPTRKTHTVEPKLVKVDVSVDGTFVADKMTEVALRPENWTKYKIVELVDHGTTVHAGQVLVKFDGEDINQAIADLELELRLSELAIRRAEEDLPRLEKSLVMNAEEAVRYDKQAKQDYDRYHKIDRPMMIKSSDFSLKYAQFYLDYTQDELDQLEKMYEADDLTEETEEIVLKRQRNMVDFAKFNLETSTMYRDQMLEVQLPRNDIRMKTSVDRANLNLGRAQLALAVDGNRARYALEKQKEARAKSLDRHVKLLGDRGLMEIKAPADGVLYYGKCVNGKWSDMAAMIKKLKPHSSAAAGSVLMTIVEPGSMHVQSVVGEKQRAELVAGQMARVILPADDSEPLAGRVTSVSATPIEPGKFAVGFDLTSSDAPAWVVPGVSCKMKVRTYEQSDALAVPEKAVHTDDDDEDVKYVWLVDADDAKAKPERRDVKTGRTSGKDIEVLKGLEAGDVISLDDESKKEKKD